MSVSTGIDAAREAAAHRAAQLVKNGMTIGLGSGRASASAIRALAERRKSEGLQFTGVPTSEPSRKLALELGIPLVEPDAVAQLDLTLDGADEADPAFNVIKGGGGALVREKLLARSSSLLVLMIEAPKQVEHLGGFHLPIAVIPFAWRSTEGRIRQYCKSAVLRQRDGKTFVTDDQLYILDLDTGPIADPAALERALKSEVGVAEVGLFVGLCDRLIIGHEDGSVTEKERSRPA
jgi:ribose 5-phosphate isomerase A